MRVLKGGVMARLVNGLGEIIPLLMTFFLLFLIQTFAENLFGCHDAFAGITGAGRRHRVIEWFHESVYQSNFGLGG
jgi:hypothetical protein